MVKKILPFIIILSAAFVAGFSLLHPGLPPTHDGEYHVVRFYEFNKALLDGNWYPRWAPDLNNRFGIPLFNFVYPLPNYFASLIHLFGFSFIDSFKLEMFLSLLIGSVFFYLWSRQFWGDLGGTVSSVFYTFSPYHFVDIYIRGSVGEVLALAIFPALLWSVTAYIKTRKQIFLPLSCLLLALLIFSHNILALMFSAFLFFYVLFFLFESKDKGLTIDIFKIFLLGFGLSSIFWLPALVEKKIVVGLEIYDVLTNFAPLYQLLIPSWGSGFSSDSAGQLSFQIGIANFIALFLGFAYLIFGKDSNLKKLLLFFVFWFFLVFFLMLQASAFIWKTVPLMNYFQFPWRFLSLEMVITSFLAGAAVKFGRARLVVAIFLIILAALLGIGYAKPAYYLNRSDNYYTNRPNFIDGTNSPGNAFNTIWFNTNLKKTDKKFVFYKGSGTVGDVKIHSSNYQAVITVSKTSVIVLNTAYFPRWSVYIDNKKVRVSGTTDGLFSFPLGSGKHFVSVVFEDTYDRKLGTLLFFAALLIIISLFGKAIFGRIKR